LTCDQLGGPSAGLFGLNNRSRVQPKDQDQYVWCGLHYGQWTQLVVAALFALLFVVALWSKMGAPGAQPSRMTIEGGGLEVDSPSMKLKLSGEQKR
jgi:hypothetical protein